FFRAGIEHHPAPLFQLRTQMRDVPLFVFSLFVCTGQRRVQEGRTLFHETALTIFLSARFCTGCDVGESVVFHDHGDKGSWCFDNRISA
ncbi:MAG: hypothetical protein G5701_05165, partial [Serratia symbiotica]|nr:hypothetical protein [Serratia symbiotica]